MRRLDRISFFKISCLVKSSVFKKLINANGLNATLSLGLKFNNAHGIHAHAFVKCGNQIVYQEAMGFTEVYSIN